MPSLKDIGQQGFGLARFAGGQLGRFAGRATAEGFALFQRVRNPAPDPKPGMDDVTLTRKVESELFRGSSAPKDTVDVNAVDGVVYLRGRVKNPAESKALEARANAIPEVRRVENLLRLAKTPSPTRADSPASQRKSTDGAQTRQRKRVTKTAERRGVEGAEPSPRAVAKEGSGRKPAPMGSQDEKVEAEGAAQAGGGGSGSRSGSKGRERGGRGTAGGATTGAASAPGGGSTGGSGGSSGGTS